MTPAAVFGDAELWIAAGGVLFLIILTVEMRRHRRRLKTRRKDGSEADREPEGGP